MKANWKTLTTMLVASLAAVSILGAQACQRGSSESYTTLTAQDLSALIDTLPEMNRRMIAGNANQRKSFISQFKQMFSLAQAAQAEGLDRTEEFKRQFEVTVDGLLVTEAQKRNPDEKYSEEEGKAYFASHESDFEADLKAVSADAPQPPTPEQVEMMKVQWSEMKVRAARARAAGLDKDPLVAVQIKFRRANMLANAYSKSLEEKFQPTPEEIKQYVAEHPEADLEKIKEKAEGLYERVKKGEDFIAIAKQFTEDGSRENGGDLGWFTRGKMDPDFEKAAFALQPGQTSELIKTQFGYHIIRLDERRMVKKPAEPGQKEGASGEMEEEIRARHIYLSTQEADSVKQVLAQKKIKRAMEDATLKYPVTAPEDFTVNVGPQPGLQMPSDPGSGRMITPNGQSTPNQ